MSVTAHVNIEGGLHDTAFVLEENTASGIISIRNKIKNIDKLPKHYTYTLIKDGVVTEFDSKDKYQEFRKSNPGGTSEVSDEQDIKITLMVMVPANTSTNITSTFGIVELVNFNGSVNVDAPFGGIDATLVTANTGKLEVTTTYGHIYSNLDLPLMEENGRDFYTSITAKPGKGSNYILKSTYGRIYLRKP
jgi:hypothetical protein